MHDVEQNTKTATVLAGKQAWQKMKRETKLCFPQLFVAVSEFLPETQQQQCSRDTL